MSVEQRVSHPHIPTLEAFLSADAAEVASIAPATLVFAAGGTRRAAVLDGVRIDDPRMMMRHGVQQFMATVEVLFTLGVEHIFAHTALSNNLRRPVSIVAI
jgi:hypothetical protein